MSPCCKDMRRLLAKLLGISRESSGILRQVPARISHQVPLVVETYFGCFVGVTQQTSSQSLGRKIVILEDGNNGSIWPTRRGKPCFVHRFLCSIVFDLLRSSQIKDLTNSESLKLGLAFCSQCARVCTSEDKAPAYTASRKLCVSANVTEVAYTRNVICSLGSCAVGKSVLFHLRLSVAIRLNFEIEVEVSHFLCPIRVLT